MNHRSGSDRPAPTGASGESGETLIETLITVILMGLVILGLVTGLATSVKISDQGWRLGKGSVQATNLAEALRALPYSSCAAGNSGTAGPATAYQSQLTVPAGFTLKVTGIYLTSTAAPANATTPASAGFGTCPASDLGVQELTIKLVYTGGAKYSVPPVTIVKRNDACSSQAKIRLGYLAGQTC